ncbi:MAG: alpha/beta hydrolase [Lachnospiraceae bacterium]|nr:alpha/beta hydrolase [Lachnospiraceae bacterium]
MDYREMIERLRNGAEDSCKDGVRYVVKPIPDRIGDGILDPRLLEAAKGGVGISYPKDNRNVTEQELKIIRQEIGAPNREVTKGALSEQNYEILKEDGSKIVFRRYEAEKKEKLPVLIYIHGGGFIGGELEMCENLCRDIARSAPAAVFSVEYRLCPEFQYPFAVNDCFDAVDYILEHLGEWGLEESAVSIAGDSAGGNLALCCSMREKYNRTNRIRQQILLYPAINIGKYEFDDFHWREDFYTWSSDAEEREIQGKLARDVGIFDDLMAETYAGGIGRTKDIYVCPILNTDWSDMPETVLVLGEYDYLSQEGIYLAGKLAQAQNTVSVYWYKGMCHAFGEHLGDFPQAEDMMRVMAEKV